jgi:hypothetical protein
MTAELNRFREHRQTLADEIQLRQLRRYDDGSTLGKIGWKRLMG